MQGHMGQSNSLAIGIHCFSVCVDFIVDRVDTLRGQELTSGGS